MKGSRLCIAVVQRDVATVEELMADEGLGQFIDFSVGLVCYTSLILLGCTALLIIRV